MTSQALLLETKPHATQIDYLLAAFRTHPSFLLASHTRPDGDAIGSVLALAEVLDQLGCQADVVFADPIPSSYSTLPNIGRIHHTPSANDVDPTGTTPAILLECDGIGRTGLLGLEGRTLINIDHHASGRPFASVNWIDEHACAVAAMVYHIAVAANVEITPSMATCLYAGILSDTGTFTYSSTTADTFAMVHHLAACGANPSRIARDIYLSNPASKIRLLGIALSNLQCDDDLAWTWVTSEDMDRIGAIAEDCEGVVNYLISIAGVESAVFLREVANADQFRLSIRSKGETDVARIAERFGGGGHRNASGCTLDGPLPVALERILTQLRTGL
ncbi:DHH family phosphoesterase [Tunturibacter empetritectus]|uniref:Phosphoesterase RecJ-like protein n=1 Tax=Tunturiibacter empetritectus TaxID=3069691 RepID=A0A7W8IM73_9BACT|nr:bifunctional oligoribonuclease/PAP phosphatase NrnA [Edaphobacter lichenicola]MBB5319050.1 phosphoesterase RecJ-like protein [Edaphobacter lichenicola]